MSRTPLLLLLVLAMLSSPVAWAADKSCAIVLMHGKWGNPRFVAGFGEALSDLCEYESLEMPWSQRRNYDADYPEALAEIARQVTRFREQGFQRVIVAGHSFGANAAIAYMANHGDADGVMAIGPGHTPEIFYERGRTRESVDQARAMVNEGKGEETSGFHDINQDREQKIRMRARIYLSYFDPDGIGNMGRSADGFYKAVPFAWIIGTSDRLSRGGPQYAHARAPEHPKSTYLEVSADHVSVLDAPGRQAAREWLLSLDAN